MFKKILSKALPKNQFARGVSVLIGGTAGAQLLSILAAPILTRLYSPDDFGMLAVFTALLTFFTVISAGRYELTIPLPDSEQDAADLTVLGFSLVLCTTIISAFIFIIWPQKIATIINTPQLANYLWIIPLGVFFLGSYQVFNKWAVRQKQFTVIAKTRVYQSVGTLAIQLGGHSLGPLALMGGHAIGQGIGASGLAYSALKRPELKKSSWRNLKKQAYRYKDFPIFSTWTALFNTASLQFAPIMFIAIFGATVTGLYALTLRMLTLPSSLIGNAVGSVFLSEAPKAKRDGNLAELVTKLHSRLAMAGALPLVVLLLFGPDLFALVFGEEWRKAGVYSQWMAPWIFLQFQWSPLSMLSTVLELQRQALIAQVFTFISRFGSILIAMLLGSTADNSIFIFAVVSAVVYLLIMFWFMIKAGVKIYSICIADIKYVSAAFILTLPVWLFFRNIL